MHKTYINRRIEKDEKEIYNFHVYTIQNKLKVLHRDEQFLESPNKNYEVRM